MSYMLLIHEKPGDRENWPQLTGRARFERMMAFAADLQARGILLAGESLSADRKGCRIEQRGGRRRTITDGPFAEAKEIVGGFFLLDCDTREEALAIAEECPAGEWSTLEIRPIGPGFEPKQG